VTTNEISMSMMMVTTNEISMSMMMVTTNEISMLMMMVMTNEKIFFSHHCNESSHHHERMHQYRGQ
jgi:hypothetical protein